MHHVEGARGAMAERRHQHPDRRAQGRRSSAYVSGFAIPKNAPNKAGAYAFLDAALEPSVQEGFAVDMGYNPVVRNAKIAPDLRARIGFTPEEEKLLVNPDLEFLAKRDGGAEGLLGQGVQGRADALARAKRQ